MFQPQDLYKRVRAGKDIKSFLLSLSDRERGDVIDTEKVPVINRVMTGMLASDLSRLKGKLSVDDWGRHCLSLADLRADTTDLVNEAVRRFFYWMSDYPEEIVLCPSRSLLLQYAHFCPKGNMIIPFCQDFVFPIDYDVIARGRCVL